MLKKVASLPGGGYWVFGLTQAWAGLFGLFLLLAILLAQYVALPWFGRYDWLFVFAVMAQVFMVLARLQKPSEIPVVAIFYLLGLGIEVFQTSSMVQAWSYPGTGSLAIGSAPLFTGFLYAAIGSYILRSWRVLRVEFADYPRRRYAMLLAVAIYASFFVVHFFYGLSYLLILVAVIFFWRTRASYANGSKKRHLPFLLPVVSAPLLILLGEKFAAFTQLWVYTSEPSLVSKFTTWFLLLLFSCIVVDLLRMVSARWARPSKASDFRAW